MINEMRGNEDWTPGRGGSSWDVLRTERGRWMFDLLATVVHEGMLLGLAQALDDAPASGESVLIELLDDELIYLAPFAGFDLRDRQRDALPTQEARRLIESGEARAASDVYVAATLRAHEAFSEWNVGILLRYIDGDREIVDSTG
jgi:hypothetical protein